MRREEVNGFRFNYNNTGVYRTAYMYDTQDYKEANLLGDFYLDFDKDLDTDEQEEAFNVVRKEALWAAQYLSSILSVPKDEIYFFFSGSKGIHITVPYEIMNVKPDQHLNSVYRLMAEKIKKICTAETLDLKIYDNRRLFRIPNSLHQKTSLYKIYLSIEEVQSLSLENIRELALEPRSIPRKTKTPSNKTAMEFQKYYKEFNKKLNKAKEVKYFDSKVIENPPPCVKYLLENQIGSGQRNDTAAFLSSFFRQSGLSQEESLIKLQNWNSGYCEPPLPHGEINTTNTSIYSNEVVKMGCGKAQMISVCNKKECNIIKGGKF